jgi:predicted nuclease with TOPRIM domain
MDRPRGIVAKALPGQENKLVEIQRSLRTARISASRLRSALDLLNDEIRALKEQRDELRGLYDNTSDSWLEME